MPPLLRRIFVKPLLLCFLLVHEEVGSEDIFAVHEWSVHSVKRFAVDYSFVNKIDGSNATLREVSGCRFYANNQVALIGDEGELFTGHIEVSDNEMDVKVLTRVPLSSVNGDWVDSESLTFVNDSLFISTEAHTRHDGAYSALAISKYDLYTGQALEQDALRIPKFITANVGNNLGFEALTAMNQIHGKSLLTTTEGPLTNDEDKTRRFLLTGFPESNASVIAEYHASTLDDGTSLGVVDFEALATTFLALERGYSQGSNTIRLFEVAFSFDNQQNTTIKRQLFEWNTSNPLGNELEVDNYEGICLFPNATFDKSNKLAMARLLLVNDDNTNPSQLGTQFVALDISFRFDLDSQPSPPSIQFWNRLVLSNTTSQNGTTNITMNTTNETHTKIDDDQHKEDDNTDFIPGYDDDEYAGDPDTVGRPNNQWLWLLPAVIFVLMVIALCRTFRTQQPNSSQEDDDGIELSYASSTSKSKDGAKYGRIDHDEFSILPVDDYDDDSQYL